MLLKYLESKIILVLQTFKLQSDQLAILDRLILFTIRLREEVRKNGGL